ncbi:FAD-dependent oxidoreductase [Agrobacterium tumefaciens]|uniref:FAD-dependent oxidoreductase n=1 Tax=Agrobacterium tumefaciens TaxID=358 RepID=UPI0015720DED|nr:FAD-dependent oxidoreductase [Agrobacterium tumefaciens]NSX89169.1 FAD-dependent oxidoreductase [Agrobacterium tumefaciens]
MGETISGSVVKLVRYPVSSLAGEELERATLEPRGIVGDRRFGFFERETGNHIFPARDGRWNAAPQLHARLRDRLELSVDGLVWRPADDGDILSRIEAVFGRAVDLHAYGPDYVPRYAVSPLHILSLQSLDRLRQLIPASMVDYRRFRPNILIDLPNEPGDVPEYALLGQEFAVAGVRMRGIRPCGRCGFTTLKIGDLPEDANVLRTLVKRYERNFGIYCDVIEGGEITLGEKLAARRAVPSIDPVLIVGAGQAGAMAARALRRLGYTGTIRLYGSERHAPYERPPLSKRLVAGERQPLAPILSATEAETSKISLHLGTTVEAVDLAGRRIETSDGTEFGFGTLILATGGTARRQPDLDRGHGRVHVLRTLEDAERIAGILRPGVRLFVFGGGWIGMEAASFARQADAEVTLFARSTRLAPRILPPEISQQLEQLHRDNGVVLRLGVDPNFKEMEGGIRCSIGNQVQEADHLVVAIGMVPLDGLARRAGLTCRDGIVTDADSATEIRGIYAIGDVARHPLGRIESWQNANVQAERAARHILGQQQAPNEPPYFWSDQFGHRLQIAGLPDPKASLVSAEDGFWDYGRFAVGIDRPQLIHRVTRRLTEAPATPSAISVRDVPRSEHHLCRAAEISEGALVQIDHPGRGLLAVTLQKGIYRAMDDHCPHSVASLSKGFIEDGHVVCPLHFAEFDICNGAPRNAPDGCGHLVVHPVLERDGELYVLLPDPAG